MTTPCTRSASRSIRTTRARYTRDVEPLTHRVAEQRSLALHAEVARRLPEHPELVLQARSRLDAWQDSGTPPWWMVEWRELLSRSIDEIIAVLTDPGQHARDLRQCSPFAGALEPRERWRILRGTGGQEGTE